MTNESIIPNQKGTTTVTDDKNYGSNKEMTEEDKIIAKNFSTVALPPLHQDFIDAVKQCMRDYYDLNIRLIEDNGGLVLP